MATFLAAFFSFLFGFIIVTILWDGVAGPESLSYLLLFPVAGILLLLMAVTGHFSSKLEPEYYPNGLISGLLLGIVLSLLWQMMESIDQNRPTILEASYFNEEGVDLFLRTNGTFMVIETNVLETRRHYGSYTINQDTILFSREIIVNGDILSPKFYFFGDKLRFYRSGPNVKSPGDTLMYITKDKIRRKERY